MNKLNFKSMTSFSPFSVFYFWNSCVLLKARTRICTFCNCLVLAKSKLTRSNRIFLTTITIQTGKEMHNLITKPIRYKYTRKASNNKFKLEHTHNCNHTDTIHTYTNIQTHLKIMIRTLIKTGSSKS